MDTSLRARPSINTLTTFSEAALLHTSVKVQIFADG